ncbi:MAG: adenylyltransferase/cytidyltransferase family protein [Candidatus Pacebacteria bacterium]|nr:adenylyltransferase/cytidyltransferase family protein [Candidatus Paceibacterota bacterium]
MKKVMIFGTFDIFHKGHEDFFRQAREFGQYLIVVVARNENVLKIKGNLPRNNEIARRDEIVKSGLADEVVLGNYSDKYKIIQDNKPDVICLGYDQQVSEDELKNKLIKFGLENTRIVRLNSFHPKTYKSSKLRK